MEVLPRILKTTMSRLILIIVALASIYVTATAKSAGDLAERKRVLFLFSHDSQLPAQMVIENALRSNLQADPQVQVEIYSEYLDAVRIHTRPLSRRS